jgi:large subunit ribosomal protein L15
MKINEISKPKGAIHKKRRVGRGNGSGWGKTCGRGSDGQNSRSGGGVRPGFEGGQMPLIRRLPKRGFTNIFRKEFLPVNVSALESFTEAEITLELLKQKGLIKSTNVKVKILGNGELTKKLLVKAHAFSKSAKEKIEKVGGQIEEIK